MQALKSALYTVPGKDSDGVPRLRGGRCDCGHVFFPFQTYGCEVCGGTGEALRPTLLEGRGILVASAKVLLHAAKDRQAPFVVASIKLNDGPVVRTLLAEDATERRPIGVALRTQLVEVGRTEKGEALGDLRFAPES